MLKIKVRVHTTNGGGQRISKKDQKKLNDLVIRKINYEIEFIYDKWYYNERRTN
jgi:hypothetical protein